MEWSLILLRLKSIIPGNFIDIYVWQFLFVLGILWKRGENNWPRMSNWLFGHKIWFSVFSILLVLSMICLRMFPILPFLSGLHVDGFSSCSLVLLVISSIKYWHYLASVLSYLGKHSMNIYLIQAFIVWYWCPYWLYSHGWHRNGGSFIVLIAVCLSISILLEWMKKKCGVYWLPGKMIEKII